MTQHSGTPVRAAAHPSVFFSEALGNGWVVEKVMRDMAGVLASIGVHARMGSLAEYEGEDIVVHSRYLYAHPVRGSRLSAAFVTHIDDRLKERELVSLFSTVDAFFCMSPHDGEFLQSIGCPPERICAPFLPFSHTELEPIRLGVFSARYPDGRKNEDWILEYLAVRPDARTTFVVVLLGEGWLPICARLTELGVSFELHQYDRAFPREYAIQRRALTSLDYLLTPGFDGGALGTYDAYASGVRLIISDVGFHRGLGDDVIYFGDQPGFESALDRVLRDSRHRQATMDARSARAFALSCYAHWVGLLGGVPPVAPPSSVGAPPGGVLPSAPPGEPFYRKYYKPVSPRRIAGLLKRWVYRIRSR